MVPLLQNKLVSQLESSSEVLLPPINLLIPFFSVDSICTKLLKRILVKHVLYYSSISCRYFVGLSKHYHCNYLTCFLHHQCQLVVPLLQNKLVSQLESPSEVLPPIINSSLFCYFLFCVFTCCICTGNRCGESTCTKLLKYIPIKLILHYSGISSRYLFGSSKYYHCNYLTCFLLHLMMMPVPTCTTSAAE